MTIRRIEALDRDALLALWERSVRATHTFLGEEDIVFYRPLVANYLADAVSEIWVLVDATSASVGFLGVGAHSIDALFLEPTHRRQGGGRRLVAHAQQVRNGTLTVDVNEQNADACRFYEALGFVVVGQSRVDETGRPFPLLHMRRASPDAPEAPARDATPAYSIAVARPRDLGVLPSIELAGAQLLTDYAPASVLTETTSANVLERAQARGQLWVARADDVPVGFAHVEIHEAAEAHLEELDVHPLHGRRGLGTQLVLAVCRWAAERGYEAVTLTTFREPPWNMPFYARLGFDVVPAAALSAPLRAVVADETRRGLDPSGRVVMRRRSQP